MRKYFILILVLVTCTFNVFGQQYTAQTSLPPVKRDGFYRILFTPDLALYAEAEFSNVRIFDHEGREVPYLLDAEAGVEHQTLFNEYYLEQKLQLDDSCTVVVLRNDSENPIRNISLVIRNAEITKEVTLSGSDDKQKWYALKEKFFLSNVNNATGTSELKIVDFPLSSYRYYKLWINDKKSAPLNIIKAGYYSDTTSGGPLYFPVPTAEFSKSDSINEKRSYVRIAFDTLRLLDKVTWTVSGTPFYLRNATLYTERERINKKGRPEIYQEYIASIELSSKNSNESFLPGIKVNNLVLEIENADNPPLQNIIANCFQLSRHADAWLTKDQVYVMKFGDAGMRAPVYDLAFFTDSIPSDIPVVEPSQVFVIEKGKTSASGTFFTSDVFIWGAIVIVIVLLAFMSVRLLKETSTQSKEV